MFFRSPTARAASGSGAMVFSTGTDSPVRGASSKRRRAASSSRRSAGAIRPASRSTMSPGTISPAGTTGVVPPRSTVAVGAAMAFSAAMAPPARARGHGGAEEHEDHEVRELAGEHPERRPPPALAQDVGAVLGEAAGGLLSRQAVGERPHSGEDVLSRHSVPARHAIANGEGTPRHWVSASSPDCLAWYMTLPAVIA